MHNLRRLWDKLEFSRRTLLIASALFFLVFSFFWRLGSQPAGLSPAEAAARSQSFGGHTLIHTSVNLPHNFLNYLAQKTGHASPAYLRAASVIFALVILAAIYKILRSWFGTFIAYLATAVVATTPLFLLAGRSGDASIMVLYPLVPLGIYFWLSRSEKLNRLAACLLPLSAVLSLYVPGGPWALAIGLVALRSVLAAIYKKMSKNLLILIAFLSMLLAVPLVYELVRQPSLVRPLLLIPPHLPNLESLKAVGWSALALAWRSGSHNELQVGRLAVLSISQLLLVFFGLYAMWSRARPKAYGLLALAAAGVVAAGLNSNFSLLLIPIASLSVIMAAGLRYLHLEWTTVFPRNPLPRGLAIVLICGLVAMQAIYGLRYSLVAWPHTVATRATYVLK